MEITDEMFLLTHRPDGRLVRLGMRDGVAYTMTAIVGLVREGRVTIDEGKEPRLHVASTELTDDPVLNHTLDRLASSRDGDRLSRCIIDKHADPREQIIERLTRHGVIEAHSGGLKSLGATTYPLRNTKERDHILTRLTQVLRDETDPSVEDAALLAALDGLGVSSKVLSERTGLSRRDLHEQIKHISQEAPGNDAVRRAMASMAAVVGATVSATAGVS